MSAKILRCISYAGAAGSLAVFLLTIFSAARWWLFHTQPWVDAMIFSAIAILVLLVPIGFSLKDRPPGRIFDFKPIIWPNKKIKIVVRLLALALLIGFVAALVAVFKMPKAQTSEDSATFLMRLPFILFVSYYCLVLYTFGLEVIFPAILFYDSSK
jgi:hypothetical protein